MIRKVALLASFLCIFTQCWGVSSQDIARLESSQGLVDTRVFGETLWTQSQIGTIFKNQDTVRTGINSRAAVLFNSGILVRLNETTLMTFHPADQNEDILEVESGSAYFLSRTSQKFPSIKTPVVSAAIRGTELVIETDHNKTIISVLDGEVDCQNAYGSITLKSGEQALTLSGQAPVKQILMKPLDAVQWALYYQAVMDVSDYIKLLGNIPEQSGLGWEALQNGQYDRAQEYFTGNEMSDILGQSIMAYHKGDIQQAFTILNSLKNKQAPIIQIYQTSLYLSVGQVLKAEESLKNLEENIDSISESTRPILFANLYALKSIIALTKNNKEEALTLAQKAMTEYPQSAAAAMALSYVSQSYFDLDKSLSLAADLVNRYPSSTFYLSRLAELELSFGHIKKADRLAHRAAERGRFSAHAQTVLGYTLLVQYKTREAIKHFNCAITLDNAHGLARLGLGLALIRQNKLVEGRRQIEIAVLLEPGVSLYRSYLGKAYFEEKRDSRAAHEYKIAKNLDPKDPTPYLYDAFYKLANARPIEALWDIEDSIKLNDNRAVYRSRLLLDQDQAVRGTSLSQAFTSVGFDEAAKIEAIKSISSDYANYSAHLLLAGSYFNSPNKNQATLTELLITRLLLPPNFNPVDPSIRGDASFNEYTSLFDREQFRLFFDLSARSEDKAIEGRVIHSGAIERFYYILSYFPDYQGGYRENDWSRTHGAILFTQAQLSYNDTLSYEYLYGKEKQGDVSINFDPHADNLDRDYKLDNTIHRLGYHHRFGPNAHFISQFLYIDREISVKDDAQRSFLINAVSGKDVIASLPASAFFDETQIYRLKGIRTDMQLIWDSSLVSLIAGGGIMDADANNDSLDYAPFEATGTITDFLLTSSGKHPEESQRVYLYSTWHLQEWLDASAALSYTRLRVADILLPPPFSDQTRIIDLWSPKFGISLYLNPNTTLRAAYFKTLGPSGFIDLESIEPTQVAGFNQLIDDIPGTDSETYTVGVDHKISKHSYLGLAASRRNFTRDLSFALASLNLDTLSGQLFDDVSQTDFIDQNLREKLISAYFYQIFSHSITGTLDYTFIQRQTGLFSTESNNHRVRLGLNYFHPRGWFFKTSAVWRGEELSGFTGDTTDGSQDFWITDASIGYQLPKHRGVIVLSVTNILDQDFHYEPVDIDAPFLPNRSYNLKISLNF
ncbi:MAG: TonB-dependent receptor [Chlamydiota bacterium]|nr:TonB-dependent receptor [Chlamydiota bacterium]